MNEKLAVLIQSNKGRMIPAITAFIMGGIAQFITSKGLQLPGEVAVAISGMVAALAGWGLEALTGRLNAKGVSAIQDALPGIATTGHATAGTVAMVQRLSDRVDAEPGAGPALTIAEGHEIKRLLHKICRDRPELLAELRKAVAAIPEPPKP